MSEKQNEQLPSTEYQYGFHDEDVSLYKTKKGITREIVEEISRIKGEPEWLLEFRLKSFEQFMQKKMPSWGPDLSELNFDEYTYYIKPSERMMNNWEDVPDSIKDTLNNPVKLVLITAFQSSKPIFPKDLSRVIPALLIRMSHDHGKAATALSQDSLEVTST